MAKNKVLFIIVEGQSDEVALGSSFIEAYKKQSVYVEVTNGDITSVNQSSRANIISKIGEMVKEYAKEHGLKASDFCQIVHIVDTDGAFVSENSIIEDSAAKRVIYTPTDIRTCDKASIEQRNRSKKAILNKLISTRSIWNIPYKIYYMSCNLDHVLYDKQNNLSNNKITDAISFAKRYTNNVEDFISFISESNFSVNNEYNLSWDYIKEDLHSLERHTNLGICFKIIPFTSSVRN